MGPGPRVVGGVLGRPWVGGGAGRGRGGALPSARFASTEREAWLLPGLLTNLLTLGLGGWT